MPEHLPDDPEQMLLDAFDALARQQEVGQAYEKHIVDLKEQIKLLRDRLFGRKSEQTVEPNMPQMALFNEPESEPMPVIGDADEEVVAPVPRAAVDFPKNDTQMGSWQTAEGAGGYLAVRAQTLYAPTAEKETLDACYALREKEAPLKRSLPISRAVSNGKAASI